MPQAPLASVVICTRNRSASLRRTLVSICEAARRASDDWEIVIVDNGSTDDTKQVVSEFAERLPVRHVFEPNAGLSNARNAGVRASQGDFIVWTDDDVLVDENWLNAYFQSFKAHPGRAIFGGKATPLYEEPAKEWFVEAEPELCSLLAIRNAPSWKEITRDRVPYGLNYAIRGTEQRSHLYDPNLGVAPGRRRGGEEVAVIREILAAGHSGVWVWEAAVLHRISPERQSEAYIRQFYSSHGYDYPIAGHRVGKLHSLKGIAIALAAWGKSSIKYRLMRRSKPVQSVPHLVAASIAGASLRRYLGLQLN
ncbi:glycosyltransferase family A protein [Aurantiacibacter flavus]|uniref:Glycosyltransferase family A protein n=1 Tax=Aurantiacibacter flavus TaxID=3145232 RepID=A0ABV0CT08_9SPHN